MNSIKNKRKYIYFFGLLLGGTLIAYQIYLSIYSIITYSIPKTNFLHLFLAFILIFFAIFFQILAWYFLFDEEKWRNKFLFLELLKGYALSFLPRYIPGTIWGYLSRSEWLYQNYSVSYNKSNSISLLELASTITANLILILLWINNQFVQEYFFLLIGILFLFPILIWLFINKVFKLINFSKIKFLNLGTIKFTSVPFKNWGISVISFLTHWFLLSNGLNQILVFLGNPSIGYLDSMFATCISWLGGFLIFFVPSGIGIRESVLYFVLKNFSQVNLNTINIASILFRLLIIVAELIWILFKFIKIRNNSVPNES